MRTWFVTGCSTGIGRGIAKAVLKAGDQAVVTARNVSKIQDFEMQYPNTCMVLPLDLIDVHSMELAVNRAYERFGKIDVLVNNAGYGYRAPIYKKSKQSLKRPVFFTCLYEDCRLLANFIRTYFD